MSKKNLLNESQIRQFMKLAKLQPLTPGFVQGLDESHGRGKQEGDAGYGHPDNNSRLEEADEEAELHATEDELSDMDSEADREGDEIDDLEADMGDAGADDGAEQMISVGDLMDALTAALEDVTGQPVEATVDGEDEVEADVMDDAAMDMDDAAIEMDAEEDEMLQEKAYTAKKEKPGADKRKGAEKRGAEGTLAKTKGHGRVDYVNEEEGSKKGEYRRKDKDGKVGKRAGEGKDGHYKDYEGPAGGNKGDKSKTDPGHKDYMKESAATDELVEQITKRVAARILKSALKKNSNVNEGVMGDLGRMAKKGLARATGTSADEYADKYTGQVMSAIDQMHRKFTKSDLTPEQREHAEALAKSESSGTMGHSGDPKELARRILGDIYTTDSLGADEAALRKLQRA
jgi:hypothetical protein